MPLRDLRQVCDRRQLGEADEPEVRLVHAQEDRSLGADRLLVVGRARPVRRSHFDQARTGSRQNVRNPETVADLDQLAARDQDVAPLGERGQGEQHRSGVVVDDERGFGSGQPAQDPGDVVLPGTAGPRAQVVLEVRVATADLAHPLEGRFGERSPAEVRVHDDPGGVEGPPEPRGSCRAELVGQPRLEVARIGAGLDLLARARENNSRCLDGERVVDRPGELVDRRQVAQAHDQSVRSYSASALRGSMRTAVPFRP